MAKRTFEIADLKVAPGSFGFTRLPVTKLLTGEMLFLPLHVINGEEDGPVVGMTCAVHGAEYHPIRIVRETLRTVDPVNLKGTIVALPVCNPLAFAAGTRITPEEDDVDFANLNRVFPGRRKKALFGIGEPPASDRSLTEIIASVLAEEVLPCIQHLLDFHCHAEELGLIKVIQQKGGEDQQAALTQGMCRALGLGLIHEHSANTNTISGLAAAMGISTCVPEIGGGRISAPADQRALEIGMRGIRNILKYLGMIEGDLDLPNRQLVFEVAPHIRPSISGYLVSRFDPDQLFLGEESGVPVKAGEVLGTVFDPYTFEDLETLQAPVDGILYIARRSGPVRTGGHAYSIADLQQSRWIE
jgi:predicted deacylase